MRTTFEPITRKSYNKRIKAFNKEYRFAEKMTQYFAEKYGNTYDPKNSTWLKFLNGVRKNLPREDEIID